MSQTAANVGPNAVEGVYNVLATPFSADGEVDEASLRAMARAFLEAGVDGFTVLGVAGEAHKLTGAERQQVLAAIIDEVGGRVPVIAGVSSGGTHTTIALCREAQSAGASGAMIAPPLFSAAGTALTRYFAAVAEAVDLPIVLQDYPPVNGVTLSPAALAQLAAEVPAITAIKLEDPPTAHRTARTLELVREPVSVVGGLGGMYLLHELRAGTNGCMTGFAFPEALITIVRAWQSGDHEQAVAAYERYLPLLVLEGQPKIGLGLRKQLLYERGYIRSPIVRPPADEIAPAILADLSATRDRVGLR